MINKEMNNPTEKKMGKRLKLTFSKEGVAREGSLRKMPSTLSRQGK